MNKLPFFSQLDRIDAAVKRGHASLDYERDLEGFLSDPAVQQYFFEVIGAEASWLPALRGAGIFLQPPAAIDTLEGRLYPSWAATKYLIRAAPYAPEDVLATSFAIPSVDNPRVSADLIAAACTMPGHLAAQLIERLTMWLQTNHPQLLFDPACRLMGHLAQEGESEAARTVGLLLIEKILSNRANAWRYDNVLQRFQGALIPLMPLRALRDLCDALYRQWHRPAQRSVEMPSNWQRPAIEDSVQNRMHGLDDVLVSTVRDAAERAVQQVSISVNSVISILNDYDHPIFRRLVLHVLRAVGANSLEIVTRYLKDPDFLYGEGVWHEYSLLLQDSFHRLPVGDQADVLELIDAGPPHLRGASTAANHTEDDDSLKRLNVWQLARLLPIEHSLPPEQQRYLHKLTSRYPRPKHPTFQQYIEVSDGYVDEVGGMQLVGKSVMGVRNLLLSVSRTDNQLGQSSIEDQLVQAVASAPEEFAAKANLFVSVGPQYVSTLLDCLRVAHAQQIQWAWLPVLTLCRAVAENMDGLDTRSTIHHSQRWREARLSALRVIVEGLKQVGTAPPLELRAEVWAVIAILAGDLDPSIVDEKNYLEGDRDPAALALNSVRGLAMLGVVQYGLWLLRQSTRNAVDTLDTAQMSRIRRILDQHLELVNERSLAVRSVYGQYFPWLLLIDEAWARQNISRIFPVDSNTMLLRNAAWNSYLRYCPPYDATFDILHDEYARAVEQPPRPPKNMKEIDHGDPYARLGEHLIVLYWRGLLPLDGDRLFARYWIVAPPLYRAHVVHTAGLWLGNWDPPVPYEMVRRLQEFWDWHEDVHVVKFRSGGDELAEFGWWFASGIFEDHWSLAHLYSVIAKVHRVEPTFAVTARLAMLAPREPLNVARCLKALIQFAPDMDQLFLKEEEVAAVIEAALVSKDNEAANIALYLLDSLGRRFLGLRSLAPQNRDTPTIIRWQVALKKTPYSRGFFNIPSVYYGFIRDTDGLVTLDLQGYGAIEGEARHNDSQSGTVRISGKAPLRNWFRANFNPLNAVQVDIVRPDYLRLYLPGASES